MKIVKGDTHISAPNWLIVLGVIGAVDIVQIIANAVIENKKSD